MTDLVPTGRFADTSSPEVKFVVVGPTEQYPEPTVLLGYHYEDDNGVEQGRVFVLSVDEAENLGMKLIRASRGEHD